MRLEIIIPDDTRPELKHKLANLTKRLSDDPELVDSLVPTSEEELPDYLGILDQGRKSLSRSKSREEIDAALRELRSEW